MLIPHPRDLSVLSKLSNLFVSVFQYVFLHSVTLFGTFSLKYHGTRTLLQDDRASETGQAAEVRESTLSVHACFLIKNLSQRDEHVRDISVSLLTQLRERFTQVNLCYGYVFFSLIF